MSETWKLQISFKIDGVHMLNLRADTSEELSAQLAWAVENKEQLQIACAALQGDRKAPPASPTHQGAKAAPVSTSSEVGPIGIDGVSLKRGPKDGPAWKSPMYVVTFSDGSSASTFDKLDGEAAQSLVGRSAYVVLKPGSNPKYRNIDKGGVRSAA